MRILLIEDDKDLCESLVSAFKKENISLDFCNDGNEGSMLICESFYQVIILDRMLPGIDGITLLKKAREEGIHTPVILLTALGQIQNRIEGLDAGADDYLIKPFDTGELIARVKALSRRNATFLEKNNISFGNLTLDVDEMILSGNGKNLQLSPKECALTEQLMKNPEKLLSRDYLLGSIWGVSDIVEEANLDTYICFLRRRFRNLDSNVTITTVRGMGYRLEQSI